MLFLAHCASKLSPAGKNGQGGRAAVVSNASPLFNSDKGPNAIRQWLLDEDLIDAIIALPTSMFYGTGIATYVWILDTNKDPEREGKIQLIDGSGQWDSLRKPMGDKRREMSEKHRATSARGVQGVRVRGPGDLARDDAGGLHVPRRACVQAGAARDALQRRGCRGAARAAGTSPTSTSRCCESLDGTVWNDLPKAFPQAAKAAGLKAPLGLVDAVMKAMARAGRRTRRWPSTGRASP